MSGHQQTLQTERDVRPADQIIHKAAWLYYTHGLRQDEVARRLDISRASVAMYLRKARESGIVTITTSTRLFNADVLARQLEDRFGLEAVWVVAPSEQQAAVGGVADAVIQAAARSAPERRLDASPA